MNIGKLAKEASYTLEIVVLKSNRGYYLGTSQECMPVSRESEEYYSSEALASKALAEGAWTQRLHP
jgi:hypothetical protein